MLPNIKGTLFEKLFGRSEYVDTLPDRNALKTEAQMVSDMFTSSVSALLNPVIFPNKRLNELGQLIWNLVHHRITHTILHPTLPSMHFYGEAKGGPLAAQMAAYDGNNRADQTVGP